MIVSIKMACSDTMPKKTMNFVKSKAQAVKYYM